MAIDKRLLVELKLERLWNTILFKQVENEREFFAKFIN